MQSSPGDVTRLLTVWSGGDPKALEELAPLVEEELRRLARLYLSREKVGHTLQPTALINEAYLRLLKWHSVDWQGRAHFIAVAAKMMRRILVNHAVSRRSDKRKRGSAVLVSLAEAAGVPKEPKTGSSRSRANRLTEMDERKGRLVELRFFGGLTAEAAAEVLGISLRTVHREWDLARAWLFRALHR